MTTPQRPFKIDFHTHILPKNWPNLKEKYGYGGFVQLDHHHPCKAKMIVDGKMFREIDHNCWNPDVRQRECEATQVDVQVLSTVPVMFSYWAKPEHCLDLSRYLNDHIAQVVSENPKRFIGLGTLPMQAPELAVIELRRCVQDLGLVGVEIGTHVNDWNLDAPELFPIFQEAEKLGAIVFVHPWDMLGKDRMTKYWLPWLVGMPAETCLAMSCMIFGGVLEKLPNLKICFAHGGDLVAVDNKKPPTSYLGKMWVDSLVHDANVLQYLVETMGENRVMLGSDYPFPLGEDMPGKLVEESTTLTQEQKEKILYKNALDFLGMPDFFAGTPSTPSTPVLGVQTPSYQTPDGSLSTLSSQVEQLSV